MKTKLTSCIAILLTVMGASSALGDRTLSELLVFPADVSLTHSRDRQSLIVQAVYDDGITMDVTGQVSWQLADTQLARLEGNTLYPLADGQTSLHVALEQFQVDVPVTISGATVDRPISFQLDVMPVFMKAGCNAGSCHGAARGKDGFRLSLYGFDPAGDYHRLTREMIGRRVNVAVPRQCLMIEKAIGEVSHSGGQRFQRESELYETLVRWLEAETPYDSGEIPQAVSVELYPTDGVLQGSGATQQLTVRAKYSDGSDRDVTSLAYFLTSNENSAQVTQAGLVTAANRGEAFVMARFETHTVGSPFIVLPADMEFQWTPTTENNYIDTLVHEKLKKLRIQPSEICGDREFIRRTSLDICGMLPTVEQTEQFVADPDPDKRAKLVDQLLQRKEFVELWVMKWSELLQIRSSQQVSYKAALLYYNWLQEQIAGNVAIDQLVKKLLGAQGGTFSNAATNYYQNEQDTLKIAENVAQVFMGMRIQCAQCHNHPFDRWTMDDYYGFAAFFSQIGRKAGEDPRETIVFDRRVGDVTHPVAGRVMAPKFLGGDVPDTAGRDRREVLADWLASHDNPYFARNLANIVWAHFFGRGIVDEVDDVRVSNPPSNAPLLDELARKFTEYQFDFKKIVRDICNSHTYQLSTQTNVSNEMDETNFSHALLRRIRAEILLDVISSVTETKNKFPGLPIGARAVQIADGNTSTYFLNTFGRAQRTSVCACEVKVEPNLSQALHLLNGDTVQNKIQQGGVIGRLLESGKTPEQVMDDLYVRCFSRLPTETEKDNVRRLLAETEDQRAALEDLFWALLNSREFVFNH